MLNTGCRPLTHRVWVPVGQALGQAVLCHSVVPTHIAGSRRVIPLMLLLPPNLVGAGSITVGSVDTSSGVTGQLLSSDFSTYGPVS